MKTPESIAIRAAADLIMENGLWLPGEGGSMGRDKTPHCVLTALGRVTSHDPELEDRCRDAIIRYLHLVPNVDDVGLPVAQWSDGQWPDHSKVVAGLRKVATTLERVART